MREMASVFKALSDETRLKMLGLLMREGELCVCDFVTVLGVTQSKASRHLRYLANAGLVVDRREAVWSYYRITPKPAPLQKSILSALKKIAPQHVPEALFAALEAWRAEKACGGVSCGKAPAAPGRKAVSV